MTRLNENIAQSNYLIAVLLMLSDEESPPDDPQLLDLMRETSKEKDDASKLVSYMTCMHKQFKQKTHR